MSDFSSLEDKINATAAKNAAKMEALKKAKLNTEAAKGPGSIPPATASVKGKTDEKPKEEWRPGWDQPSEELAGKLSQRNADFSHPSLSPKKDKDKKKKKNKKSNQTAASAPAPAPAPTPAPIPVAPAHQLPSGAATPPLDDGSDGEDLLHASDDEVGSGDGVYDYNEQGGGPIVSDIDDVRVSTTIHQSATHTAQSSHNEGGSKKSIVRRTDALFYEAERRHVNIEEQRRAEQQNYTFMPTLTAKRHPMFKDDDQSEYENGGRSSPNAQVYDRLYEDATKRVERHDQQVQKFNHLDANCTFTPEVEKSAKSLKSNSQNSHVPQDGVQRPRHEVLYEDSKVRQEKRRQWEEENKKKNPPPPSQKVEEEFNIDDLPPSRKYDPDRTEALYQDANRRRESQNRIRETEDRQLKKTFQPNIAASMKNVTAPIIADGGGAESESANQGSGGGAKSSSSSSSSDYRFDQLYADAGRRAEVAEKRQKQRANEFTFQPAIENSQKKRTGGVGGAQRFDALFEEAIQRDEKLKIKQRQAEEAYKQKHFQPSGNAQSAQIVDEAVKSGKREADPIARLYQDSAITKAKEMAQLKKKQDIENASCTFKPTLIGNKAIDKKSKKEKKQDPNEESKSRYETLYEHHSTKSMRAAELAKKVQSETDKECTFKPKKISKSGSRKTSPKKDRDEKAWEPKKRDDISPSKKKSPVKYEREEDMPAHERLFKKAKDQAEKRSEEHNKRAFLSEEHTFKPRLRKSEEGSRNRTPKRGETGEGDARSNAVQQVVQDVKSKQAKKRAGSPFTGNPSFLASDSKVMQGDNEGESRFEALYQHGVRRGLVKLSAQSAHERDRDAREMSECTFAPAMTPRLYKGPTSNKKSKSSPNGAIPPAPPRASSPINSTSSNQHLSTPTKKTSPYKPPKSVSPIKSSPSKAEKAAARGTSSHEDKEANGQKDGETDLQSRVEELLARRKKRQEERNETIKSSTQLMSSSNSASQNNASSDIPKVSLEAENGSIEEAKARKLFHAYDTNGDGVLDLREFTVYLTFVFQALAHTPQFQAHGVTPAEMAYATAGECFAEADINGDGHLTFDEFFVWVSNAPQQLHLSEEGIIEESEAKALFEAYDTNGDGVLDLEEFTSYLLSVFQAIEHTPEFEAYGASPEEVAEATAEECFAEADINGDGELNFEEFRNWFKNAPGRAVNTSLHLNEDGSIEETEARELFIAYDANGDGVLDLEEFTIYLTSVFKALEHNPDFENYNLPPEEMAQATAGECFAEADENGDGHLTFDEFKAWFLKTPASRRSSLTNQTIVEEEEEQEERKSSDLHVTFVMNGDDGNHENLGDSSSAAYLRKQAESALWQAAGMVDVHHSKDVKKQADMDKGFASSSEWWFSVAPKFCEEGCPGPHVIPSLARGALSACDLAINTETSDSKPNMRHIDPNKFTNKFLSHMHTLKALAHLLTGDHEACLESCDEALREDDVGCGPGNYVGFTWGLKAMVIFSCCGGDNQDTALVSLLRANQLHPQKSRVLTQKLQEVLNDSNIDVMEEFNQSEDAISTISSPIHADSDINLNSTNNNSFYADQNITNSMGFDEARAMKLFHAYDTNGDGVLDMREFTTYLTSVFQALAHTPEFQEHGVSPEDMAYGTAKQCFDEADIDHNGVLTFKEFLEWFQLNSGANDDDDEEEDNYGGEEQNRDGEDAIGGREADDIFDLYDVNGDDLLDIEEFTNYLESVFTALSYNPEFQMYETTPEEMAAEVALQVFKKADSNKDGYLNRDEFTTWFQDAPSRLAAAGGDDENDYADYDDEEELEIPAHTSVSSASNKGFASTRMNATVSGRGSMPASGEYQQQIPLPPAPKRSSMRAEAATNSTKAPSAAAQAQEIAAAVANKVAEVRFRMREIFKEELAAVSMEHGEEMAKLRAEREEEESRWMKEFEQIQHQCDIEVDQATGSFGREKANLLAEIETHVRTIKDMEHAHKSHLAASLAEQKRKHDQELEAAVGEVRSELEAKIQELEKNNVESLRRIQSMSSAHASVHDQLVELRGNIRVIARLRPQQGQGNSVASRSSPFDITLTNKTKTATYTYDQVLGPSASQEQCFETVKPLIRSALHGRNVCLLAYGQTGSGKTHTLVGELPSNGRTKLVENSGVMPRAVVELFEHKDLNVAIETTVYLSVLEVYNETVRDLLCDPDPNNGPPKVELSVSPAGVEVPKAMELEVPDAATTLEILDIANENRATAATDVNAHSSRSHLVVTLRIVSKSRTDGDEICNKIQLVDLAGCERTKASHVSGVQLAEATAINKSLSALGDVVAALAGNKASNKSEKKAAAAFIPYRNSKLTLLLQDALQPNGRSKVVLFVTTSPELNNWNESVSALNFASRCRAIDLYRNAGSGAGVGGTSSHQLSMGEAATEVELLNANKKIQELEHKLMKASARAANLSR